MSAQPIPLVRGDLIVLSKSQTGFVRRYCVVSAELTSSVAILKINGEKLLKIQDDGQFIQYVVSTGLQDFNLLTC